MWEFQQWRGEQLLAGVGEQSTQFRQVGVALWSCSKMLVCIYSSFIDLLYNFIISHHQLVEIMHTSEIVYM